MKIHVAQRQKIGKRQDKKQGRIHEPKSRAGGQERRKKLSVTNRLKSAKKAKCDRQTDRPTDRQTDRVGHRVACMRLKILQLKEETLPTLHSFACVLSG